VKGVIDSGGLVPDELTIALVKERLSAPDVKKGFILDGFPRTIQQADALGGFESIDSVIDFDVEDKEILVKRISGRRTCNKCNAIYNIFFGPSKKNDICDKCGGELYIRKDDEITAVRNRLDVYEQQTAPLKNYYTKKGLLKKVDASKQESVVTAQVIGLLEGLS
jgi:adenylate kinase